MNAQTRRLIFVYDADSGLFNTLADIGHKLFSPDTYRCALCALTHDHFRERRAWRAFVETLPIPCEFWHRDEFLRRHPEQAGLTFPVVLRADTGRLEPCLAREALAACSDLEALQSAIRRCAGDPIEP